MIYNQRLVWNETTLQQYHCKSLQEAEVYSQHKKKREDNKEEKENISDRKLFQAVLTASHK